VTGAIIYRILRVANASGNRPKRLYKIVWILAESGILYTSMTAFTLIGIILEGKDVDRIDGNLDAVMGISNALVSYTHLFLATNVILSRAILWLVSHSTSF
jgi:hypothetical protein